MLRISKLADYSLMIMSEIARHSDQIHNARDLATRTHLALPTVSKILKALVRAGLLLSERGSKGGYKLQQAPQDIAITHIISSIDGNFGLTECSRHAGRCSLETYCALRNNWRRVNQAIKATLDNISLADMAHPLGSIPPLPHSKQQGECHD